MRKLLLPILLCIFFLLPAKVSAEASYSTENSFTAQVTEDSNIKIVHEMSLTNFSKQNVISAITYDIPFNAQNITATLNKTPIDYTKNQTKLNLNFANQYVGVDETARFVFTYDISGFVQDNGLVKTVYIPGFNVESVENGYDLKVRYPVTWGTPTYMSSENVEQITKGEYVFLNMTTDRDVLINIGNFKSVEVNVNWDLGDSVFDVKTKLPIPSAPDKQFTFGDLSYKADGEVDAIGNEFIVLDTSNKDERTGSFAGIISAAPNNTTPQDGNQGYVKNSAKLGIGYTLPVEKIYSELLGKFIPEPKLGAGERYNVPDMLSLETHTSLDYATALVSIFREKGIYAEVVYGPTKFPFSEEYTWHYWVIYKDDTGATWKVADPYFQDLTGFNSLDKVTTERIMWGVLRDDQDIKDLGINYFQDINASINLIKSEDVLGIDNDFELSLTPIGNSFSGSAVPFELRVKNNSNRSLKLNEIALGGRKFDSNQIKDVLILPGAEKVLSVSNVVMVNPLISGERLIEGNAVIQIGSEEFERDITQQISFQIGLFSIFLNALVIFTATTLSYYYVRLLYLKHKQHGEY